MPRLPERSLPASAALVALLTVAVYVPGLAGGFAFDDYTLIVDNPFLKLADITPASLLDCALLTEMGGLKRPLAMLSFALNEALFGTSAWHYKAVNLAVHLVNLVLGWWLLAMVLEILGMARDRARWLALAAAGLWAVHPVNLTSVLYVVQRMTSLASMAMLLGCIVYLRARRRGRLTLRRGLGLIALWVAGLLCKETAALLPVYLAAIEIFVCGGHARIRAACAHRPRAAAALCASLVVILLAVVMFATDLFPSYRMRQFTPIERLMTEARVVLYYVYMLVLPEPSQFALFHDDLRPSRGLLKPWTTLPAIVTLLAAAAFTVRGKPPLVTFALAWFLGGHLLESTVLPLELMHEHRNYLPALGMTLLLVALLERLFAARPRYLLPVAVSLLLAAFATVTAVRAEHWSSPWRRVAEELVHHPDSHRSLYEFGRVTVDVALEHGDVALRREGLAAIERSLGGHDRPFLPLAALLNSALVAGEIGAAQSWTARVLDWPKPAVRLEVLRIVVQCQVRGACPPQPAPVVARVGDLVGDQGHAPWIERGALQLLARYYLRVAGDGPAARRIVDDLRGSGNLTFRARNLEILAATGSVAQAAAEARAMLASASSLLPYVRRPLWHRLEQLAALDDG